MNWKSILKRGLSILAMLSIYPCIYAFGWLVGSLIWFGFWLLATIGIFIWKPGYWQALKNLAQAYSKEK